MLLGLLLIAVAAASWGTTGATMTVLSREAAASPLLVGWGRLAVAAPCLVLAAVVSSRTAAPSPTHRAWPSRADLPLCAALGLAMAAYQVFYFRAVTRVGVAAAALLAMRRSEYSTSRARTGRPSVNAASVRSSKRQRVASGDELHAVASRGSTSPLSPGTHSTS